MSPSADEVWDQFQPTLGDRLKEDLCMMVETIDALDDRSQQTDLGPSEIGNPCTRCLAKKILGLAPAFSGDCWCRVIGTATHGWLEGAAAQWNVLANKARWYPETRVFPDTRLLPSGGSCDLYDEFTLTVIDHKIVGRERLRKFKANGPGGGYKIQAHLYGKGYVNAGHKVENVAIAFWHRGGRLRDLYVWTEPFDMKIADDALARYDTVRELALKFGEAILDQLPTDPDCYDCKRFAESETPAA